ncbi:hypothetical protein diail_2172 [Diaporthe ilicicola]|nr:hypothetical protein diail_2172 [Diaporthe ilicicola]
MAPGGCLKPPVKSAETRRIDVEPGVSQALASYLSAPPTVTERLSNHLPKDNRKKRLAEKIASLDSKAMGNGHGGSLNKT